jgi:hypothetical protein
MNRPVNINSDAPGKPAKMLGPATRGGAWRVAV